MTSPRIPTKSPSRDAERHLVLFTSISALDGTVMLLAAAGALSTLGGAIVAGLTVVAGAGAWTTARDAFPDGFRGPAARRLLRIAAGTACLTLLAAHLGGLLGAVALTVLPKAGGAALLLVALELGTGRNLRFGPVPAPITLIVLAIPLEVVLHWTP